MKWFKKNEAKVEDGSDTGGSVLKRVIPAVVILLIVVSLVIMIANYSFLPIFEVKGSKEKPGLVFTQTLLKMSEDMTTRWLPNDKIYPTIFLDNPQNFQMGLLETVRYSTRVLRDKISRLRTTDKIDLDAEAAFVFFSNDPYKWILPSAESKFMKGIKSLRAYESRLAAGQADFFPRADNLNELLDQYTSLLGGVTTRLSNAPRQKTKVISGETAGDAYTAGEKKVRVHVPWTKIDDNFYYAQGVAYGIRHMMPAVKYDFRDILKIKKADELLDRIIELLDQSQFEPWVVLNGRRGSIFANHSLQLQSLLEDARQKMRSLQDMIRE
ncbi:MAG: DUF2333 family protein [Thermodesulfobacteriota bacterium]|nr:DUF2333 family protein [Thermodesulfobacteriota bacterium]